MAPCRLGKTTWASMTVEGESVHDRRSKIRTAVKSLIASFLLGACSDSAPSQAQAPAAGTPGVAELSVCEDCPVFVKVAAAPAPLRPIRYVSKFELTWNNYLAAYDGGACTIPNPNAPPQLSGPNDILPHLDKLPDRLAGHEAGGSRYPMLHRLAPEEDQLSGRVADRRRRSVFGRCRNSSDTH